MKRVIVTAFLALLLAAVAAAAAEKAAIPTAAESAAALKRVREVFKIEYAHNTPAGRLALVEQLFKAAGESTDPAERYALLCEARDLAAAAGHVHSALTAAQKLDTLFDTKPGEAELAALNLLKKSTLSPAAASDAAFALIGSIDAALADDNMDASTKLASLADFFAAQVTDAELTGALRQRSIDARAALTESARIAQARKLLKDKPNDPVANFNVGKFLCFTLARWDEGIGYLVKVTDPRFSNPAALERSNPTDPILLTKIADGWYACAESMRGAARAHAMEHAVEWYRKALAGLTGLEQLRAEKRIETFESAIKPWDSAPYHTTPNANGISLGMTKRNVGESFLIQFDINTTSRKSACLLTKRQQEGDGSLTVLLRSQGGIEVTGDASFYQAELKGNLAVNDGQWHTVRIEKRGPTVKLFVDIMPQGSMDTLEKFSSTATWILGRHPVWNQAGPEALFRHVRIEGGN